MDRIITKTKYSRKENKQFIRFHMFHKTYTIYFMFALLIVLCIMTANNIIHQENAVMSMVLLGITMGIIPFLFISKINEVVKQETPEKIQSTDTFEVTKHKFTRSNDKIPGKAVFGWNNIDSICENDEFIYVYNTDNTGIYLKKADFVEGTPEDFRKMALENMTPDKKGNISYKRYGKVRKEYLKEKREKKKIAKEKKKLEKAKGSKK